MVQSALHVSPPLPADHSDPRLEHRFLEKLVRKIGTHSVLCRPLIGPLFQSESVAFNEQCARS